MIILKSSFIILVPKKTGMISRMIDSSKKKKWFFRSRPGAANPSSHSHPLREPRKLKFFSTFSENTSSHHHPCQQFRNRKNMSTHIRMTVQTESLESVLVARWAIGCEWNLRSMFVIVFDQASKPHPHHNLYRKLSRHSKIDAWFSPWASTPRIILPSSFPIRVSKLPSHHHPNEIPPWEKK